MADLAALRAAVADALSTVDGLTGHATNPGQLHAPCALVEPQDVDFTGAMMRGHDKWTFLVRVLCGSASNEAGQLARDAYFGTAKDIKDAIEGHLPLRGEIAQDVLVRGARKFDAWEYSGVVYVGVEFVVEVYA